MTGDGNSINVIIDESTIASVAPTDAQSGGNAPTKKLGFGLVGSGKRTSVPSVFHEEDDDDAHKDKKMRPLVPIIFVHIRLGCHYIWSLYSGLHIVGRVP